MNKLNDYIRLGISPSMLFPLSFDDELEHLCAWDRCCRFKEYQSFETFLPSDAFLRKTEITKMKQAGKILNYNTPGYFQLDGAYNPCSDDPATRKHALAAMKQHISYAAEADCSLLVMTGAPDKGQARRSALLDLYSEFFLECARYALTYGITIAIEPIERGRFKDLILGPTPECASFIKEMQNRGASNARLILDTAHLPLMEETMDTALASCLEAGLSHVHMGNAVLDPSSQFYGHTHPPIGVQKGLFDCEELASQFAALIRAGYIPSSPGSGQASVSLEVRPYPGVSGETSAQVMYEKVSCAFQEALKLV